MNTILTLTASNSFQRSSSIFSLASLFLLSLLVVINGKNDETEDITMCKSNSTQTF